MSCFCLCPVEVSLNAQRDTSWIGLQLEMCIRSFTHSFVEISIVLPEIFAFSASKKLMFFFFVVNKTSLEGSVRTNFTLFKIDPYNK